MNDMTKHQPTTEVENLRQRIAELHDLDEKRFADLNLASEQLRITIEAGNSRSIIKERVLSAENEKTRTVEISAKTISRLGESSQQIEKIISVIKDIADQTNLNVAWYQL